MQTVKSHIKALRGVATELHEFVEHEDKRIVEFLAPFVEKVTTITTQYEMEKSQLEKDMVVSLEKSKDTVFDDIVQQRASARHYSTMVTELFERMQGLVRDGLESRREAERTFMERLMSVIRSEYESILADMRSEDRQKSHFERVQNYEKLESCRIAVQVELTAKLVQQRAVLERQNKEAIAQKDKEIEQIKRRTQDQIDQMMRTVQEAKRDQENCRIELKVSTDRGKKETEALDHDIMVLQQKIQELNDHCLELEDEAKRAQMEWDLAVDDKRLFEQQMEDEMEKLRNQMAAIQASEASRQAVLNARIMGLESELQRKDKQLDNLRRERDMLQKDKDAYQSKTAALQKTHHEEVERLKQTIEALTAECEQLKEEAAQHVMTMQEMESQVAQLRNESALQKAEQEDRFRTLKADMEAAHRKTIKEKTMLRANLGVWLHDAVHLRRKEEIDMNFAGSENEMRANYDFFKSAEQHDLIVLHKICLDKIAGGYAKSPDRVLVKNMAEESSLGLLADTTELEDLVAGVVAGVDNEKAVLSGVSPLQKPGIQHASTPSTPSVLHAPSSLHGSLAPTPEFSFVDSQNVVIGPLEHAPSGASVAQSVALSIASFASAAGHGPPSGQHQVIVQQVASQEEVEKRVEAATEKMKKHYDERLEALSAEWRNKAVALAQRLERTEKELNYPRAEDLAKMKDMELQISTLMLALEEATAQRSSSPAGAPGRPASRAREELEPRSGSRATVVNMNARVVGGREIATVRPGISGSKSIGRGSTGTLPGLRVPGSTK